ncbi:MAG: hypothetical protein ACR2FF_01565 [Mycobacteriales bacterium]
MTLPADRSTRRRRRGSGGEWLDTSSQPGPGVLRPQQPRTDWITPGALVVPYGTMSAVEPTLTDIMDKVVVDDWGQVGAGPYGALRHHVDTGRLTRETLYAELAEIVAGDRPGRESDDETILLWHRGLSTSDIALGAAMLERATERGIGHRLRYA